MNKLLLILLVGLTAVRGWAALSVQLTIQEALYPGSMPGVARTNEFHLRWRQGVPIADSSSITNTQSLTMSGISIAQFRILARWPDGNAKWIKACGILPSLAAPRRRDDHAIQFRQWQYVVRPDDAPQRYGHHLLWIRRLQSRHRQWIHHHGEHRRGDVFD